MKTSVSIVIIFEYIVLVILLTILAIIISYVIRMFDYDDFWSILILLSFLNGDEC